MAKKLLIVESSKKARTIKGMLGADYVVKATAGHILEMPADDIHVNLQDFTPTLYLIRGKGKKLDEIKQAAAEAEAVYLATDPDREGEAIAQHVAERLGREVTGKAHRITFTAITQTDLRAALANPRRIDRRLVEAQTARRVTDRLVGYMVSPVLWQGLTGVRGLSAGRVQSPALWLVVERERAIRAFVPEEWWSIEAELSKQGSGGAGEQGRRGAGEQGSRGAGEQGSGGAGEQGSGGAGEQGSRGAEAQGSGGAGEQGQKFWASLFRIKGKKPELKTQAEAQRVLDDLKGAGWRVLKVEKGVRTRQPYPPFTTDSLQQAASSQLGFNPRLTMKIAQELYEGVKLAEGKAVGLITYIRTDSVAVAPEAQQVAREVVAKYFGEEYLPSRPPIYQTRDKTAQEAHEAIRPVDAWKTPKAIEPYLTPEQHKLYRLIWRRFIASQMKPAVYDTITVDIETLIKDSPTVYLFRATGSTLRFAGFLKVYGVDTDAEEARGSSPSRRLRAGAGAQGSRDAEERRREGAALPGGFAREQGSIKTLRNTQYAIRNTQYTPRDSGEDGIENPAMPDLSRGDWLTLHQLVSKQHFTQPPKRYTEAQLIGALKKLGLGRPSTYATIVETLKDRRYVGLEQKRLYPTGLGFQVCELLEKHIDLAVDVGFTARMEEDLDRIARGETDRLTVMRAFYGPFKATVERALAAASAERQAAAQVERPRRAARRYGKNTKRREPGAAGTKSRRGAKRKKGAALPESARAGQACPQCGEGVLQVKQGKFGPFLGCSRFAQGCRYTEKIG